MLIKYKLCIFFDTTINYIFVIMKIIEIINNKRRMNGFIKNIFIYIICFIEFNSTYIVIIK
ncbi:hypothetical protein PFUGPA_05792 [Plasmodium falciparum Palo Alto/Uganda]|uniref:Uncharacterized protein n=2 Tax=Plasmodium falciparum TaxID=5833 RepID=W7KAC1_PLAFO|nr:hypothetical protein PFUGPA_05792 [Plasmodium falciparum Palo Alto/Uganda]EWC90594.1 hypothetical protein PFNF54_00494 [Plasmodium falciparum NF54]